MNSFTEENYLKAIYDLNQKKTKGATTNAIAKKLATKASSVTDMVKKLAEKKLVDYKKYQGVNLSLDGKKVAINVIRKHRLWEVFLVDKLKFKWDEVHDIAEQLEHIHSKELTMRLDKFLDFPKFDPHGDPIPDEKGNILLRKESCLISELQKSDEAVIIGVNDSSPSFLQYLENKKLVLGTKIKVLDHYDFDGSFLIDVNKKEQNISKQAANNLFVKKKH